MISYFCFGILAIGMGVLALLNPDLMWEWRQFRNSLRGVNSERTETWELLNKLGGMFSIGIGIVLILIGIFAADSEENEDEILLPTIDFITYLNPTRTRVPTPTPEIEIIHTLALDTYPVDIDFNDDHSKIVAADNNNSIYIWATDSGQLLQKFQMEFDDLYFTEMVEFVDDTIITVNTGGQIQLWDENGEQLQEWQIENIALRSADVHGSLLAAGGGSTENFTIRLFNLVTGREIAVLEGHTGIVNEVAFSPDGTLLASVGRDNIVRLWDVETRKEIRSLEGHQDVIESVAFSTDGSKLVTGDKDGVIIVWDAESGYQVARLTDPEEIFVNDLAFDDDMIIVAVSSTEIRVWDTRTYESVILLEGHTQNVLLVEISGEWLASGANDNTIRLWKTE